MSYPLVIRLMLAMTLVPDASYCEAVGGGTSVFPDGARAGLVLTEERRFTNGVVYLRYRVRGPYASAPHELNSRTQVPHEILATIGI